MTVRRDDGSKKSHHLGRLCVKRLKYGFRSFSFRKWHEKRHIAGHRNFASYFSDAMIGRARAEVVEAYDCSRVAVQDNLSEARNSEATIDEIQISIGALRRFPDGRVIIWPTWLC